MVLSIGIGSFSGALYYFYIYPCFYSKLQPRSAYLYPYFFLNLDNLGVAGVAKWVVILFAGFIVLGYIFYGIDKIIKSDR